MAMAMAMAKPSKPSTNDDNDMTVPPQLLAQLLKYQTQRLNAYLETDIMKAVRCSKCNAIPDDHWESDVIVDAESD